MVAKYTYHKTEKLKSRKLIDGLFTGGKSFSVFPIKVFYMFLPDATTQPVQAGVGVSARNFRKAVDRNRIKRLLRECYRLNKLSLHERIQQSNKPIAVFFLYTGKELPEYALLDEKMKVVITKLESLLV